MPEIGEDEHKIAPDETEMDSVNGMITIDKGGKGELGEILSCMKYITRRMKDKDKDNEILGEWQALGKVIDRILFWLSLIAIIVICAVLLGQPDDGH